MPFKISPPGDLQLGCTGCALSDIGQGFTEVEGSGSRAILVVGEAAGFNEAKCGLPFRPEAEAGSVLQMALRRAQVQRESLAICNIVRCLPPKMWLLGAPYEHEAINHCRQYMDEAIRKYKPRVILALGEIALRTLTGLSGKNLSVTSIRGFILHSPQYDLPVVASLHPSFIRRMGMAQLDVLTNDIILAAQVADGKLKLEGRDEVQYLYDIGSDMWHWLDYFKEDGGPISFDIETFYSVKQLDDSEVSAEDDAITEIQFSIAPKSAIVFPWNPEVKKFTREVLALPNDKWSWNGAIFDAPILAKQGIEIKGNHLDLMDAWHCLSGDTRLEQWEGPPVELREVVDKKLPIMLKGLDLNTQEIIPVKVSGWYKYTSKEDEFLKIIVDGSRQPIWCTKDHKVFTNTGWKRADNLTLLDKVALPKRTSNDIIVGTILGDGYINHQGRLSFHHCLAQSDWCKAKAQGMGAYFIKGKDRAMASLKLVEEFRDKFYQTDKRKIFYPELMTPQALAIWYGDDGCYKFQPKSTLGSPRLISYVANFDTAIYYFRALFGDKNVTVHNYIPRLGGGVIAIINSARLDFFEMLAPYIHPSMSRKLPVELRDQYSGWMDTPTDLLYGVVKSIEATKEFSSKHPNDRNEYCVDVDDDSHAFFTRGGLVHNCLQPDLPRGLQFVSSFFCPEIGPWKHLNQTDKYWYCGRDVDSLQRIGRKLLPDLEKRGVARAFYGHIVKLRPILDRMCERGLPVDVVEQQRLRGELETEMIAINIQIQSMAPKELRAFDPTNGFAQWPKEAQAHIEVLKGKKDLWRDIYHQFQLSYEAGGEFPRLTVHQIEQSTGMIYRKFGETYRWTRTLEFNPASSKQMIGYAKHKGYKVPLVERNNGTESEQANEQVILEWAEKHNDELCKLVIDYKKRQKIIGTYIDGFKSNGDGRIHSTITFAPATGQLSSHRPSIMNFPKHGEFAKKIRKTIKARDGFKLIEIDMKSFHARTLGFEAGCKDYMRLATLDIHSFVAAHLLWNKLQNSKSTTKTDEMERDIEGLNVWLQLPDEQLAAKLKNIKTKYKELRDRKAKPCIAEGELVLTETGLKPIEKITLADRVWDGVEWVNHDGVVFQDVKEIMTYDGLTATPEHKVYTTQGQCIPFREAASLLLRLQTTGIERTAVRLPDNSFWRIQEREWLSQDQGQMRINGDNSMDLVRSSQERSYQILSTQWQVSDTKCRCAGQEIRCNHSSLQQPQESSIPLLWRTWNQMSLHIKNGVHQICERGVAPQGLCGGGNRSQEQQWSLREGQSSTSNPQTEQPEQTRYSKDNVSRARDINDRLLRIARASIRLLMAEPLSSGLENEWGASDRTDQGLCEKSSQGVQGQDPVVRKARVYDIINAGPRHRFTVSGKLVRNCILGIGFGMQANKLYKMNKESFTALKEAKEVLDLIKRLFPKVFQWQKEIQEKAHRQGYLLSKHGYLRRFFEVKRYDPKYGTWKSGESAEECLAFLPANDAFGEIRDRLIELDEKGLLEKYVFTNTIHDSIVFECPDELVNECVRVVSAILERPSTVLIDPRLGAFSCPCEASVGQDWSELVEWKL